MLNGYDRVTYLLSGAGLGFKVLNKLNSNLDFFWPPRSSDRGDKGSEGGKGKERCHLILLLLF